MKKFFLLFTLFIINACYSSDDQNKKQDLFSPQLVSASQKLEKAMSDAAEFNNNNNLSTSSSQQSLFDLGPLVTLPERKPLAERLALVGITNCSLMLSSLLDSLAGKTMYPIGVVNLIVSVSVGVNVAQIQQDKNVSSFLCSSANNKHNSSYSKNFFAPSIIKVILQDNPDAIKHLIKIGYLKS